MKRILSLAGIAMLFAFGLKAGEQKENDYNPDLLIFAGELRLYAEKAKELSQTTEDKVKEREDLTAELKATGKRLARVYFSETAEVIQNDLNKHLSVSLKENSSLKNYYVFMGNAFAELATHVLQKYKDHQKKIRTISTVAGAFVGLAVGGGYLFFKVKKAASIAALSQKDYLIAAGAIAGGTAIGFGFGSAYSAKLPMDLSVKNSKDFAAKYPHGEDFINALDHSSDLRLLMSELEAK